MEDKIIKAKLEIFGGHLDWADEELLKKIQDLSAELLAKTEAYAFIVRILPEMEPIKEIFINETIKP